MQRLYDDAAGVRPCELCGCRFDPVKMLAHMLRYSARSAAPHCVGLHRFQRLNCNCRSSPPFDIRAQAPPRGARNVLEDAPLVSRLFPPSFPAVNAAAGSSSAKTSRPEST